MRWGHPSDAKDIVVALGNGFSPSIICTLAILSLQEGTAAVMYVQGTGQLACISLCCSPVALYFSSSLSTVRTLPVPAAHQADEDTRRAMNKSFQTSGGPDESRWYGLQGVNTCQYWRPCVVIAVGAVVVVAAAAVVNYMFISFLSPSKSLIHQCFSGGRMDSEHLAGTVLPGRPSTALVDDGKPRRWVSWLVGRIWAWLKGDSSEWRIYIEIM